MTGGTSGAVGNSGGRAGKSVGVQGSGMGMSDGRATVSEVAGRTTAVGDCRILAGGAAVTCVTVGMGPFCIGRKASSSGVASIPSRGEEKALLSSGNSGSSCRGGGIAKARSGDWTAGDKGHTMGEGEGQGAGSTRSADRAAARAGDGPGEAGDCMGEAFAIHAAAVGTGPSCES